MCIVTLSYRCGRSIVERMRARLDMDHTAQKDKVTMHIRALIVALLFLSVGSAQAADLPKSFLGDWTNRDGSSEHEVTGIHVGPRTYHEPGYNCDIRSITAKNDAATSQHTLVYLVDMACSGDGENPGRPQRIREIWALRRIAGKDVLVMAGTVGPTFPSIHILERPE